MQLLFDIFASISAYVGKGPHFCKAALYSVNTLTVWGFLKAI